MKPARALILGFALVAGGTAAFLIGPSDQKKSHAPRANKIDTLSLVVKSKVDANKIAEGNTDRATASAPTALVSAPTNDAS